MKIKTRDFGEIEIDEAEIITFRQPVYGFEDLKRYALLYDQEINNGFVWMQSLEEPEICFIMIDPDVLSVEYRPVFPGALGELMGEEDCVCWCILSIPQNFEETTVNLKSPILINPAQKCGAQIILDGNYPLRQPLMTKGEEPAKC